MAAALREKHIPYAHYVFPKGFHGLSAANKDFFGGWNGGEYTLEQVMKAVGAVKAGKGINVSDQRKKELEEQFAENTQPPEQPSIDMSWSEDAGLWPDLAMAWMKRLQNVFNLYLQNGFNKFLLDFNFYCDIVVTFKPLMRQVGHWNGNRDEYIC